LPATARRNYTIWGKIYYKVAEIQEFLRKKRKGSPDHESSLEDDIQI
jgi:hypothetical protein